MATVFRYIASELTVEKNQTWLMEEHEELLTTMSTKCAIIKQLTGARKCSKQISQCNPIPTFCSIILYCRRFIRRKSGIKFYVRQFRNMAEWRSAKLWHKLSSLYWDKSRQIYIYDIYVDDSYLLKYLRENCCCWTQSCVYAWSRNLWHFSAEKTHTLTHSP